MRNLIIITVVLMSFKLSGQTLKDYLEIARQNNPGLTAKQTEVQVAWQKIPQVAVLPEPTVNASFFLDPMMLPMGNQIGSISVMQMFPWFGALDAMESEVTRMAEVKLQAVEVAKNELFFKVKNAWYPLLELDAQIQIQKDLLRLLETDKELATVMFQQGSAPMVDPIRVDIMMDEVKTQIALLEQKRRPLEVAFNRLLNRKDDLPVLFSPELPESLTAKDVQMDSFFADNPMLAALDKQIQVAIEGEKVAGYSRKPMIGAGLQYMPLIKRQNSDLHLLPNTGRDMVMPMVSLTLPIWKKKYNAAVEENQLMQVVYADMKLELQNELAAMYEMTVYELKKMAQMYELLDLQMLKTQQAIDLVLAAYRNAGQDFEEVLRLQQQLFRYRSEQISTQTNYQLMLVKLDFLSGKLEK